MDQSYDQKTTTYGKRPLWQWVVMYLIIGGIIYLGIYYFFLSKGNGYNSNSQGVYQTQPTGIAPTSGSTAVPEPSQVVQQAENTVTLAGSGFSPTTLTIKIGTTVKWVNSSGESATVNSDPHPTHTNYSPLNLGKFDNGGTLSLTFGKAGTYGYHNHLNSSETGTIVVQ